MLTAEMTGRLNDQLNLEFFSANLYLQMSAWCSDKGYEGAASFLKMHSREEMEHMQRLFNYLSDTGAMPVLGTIAAPPVAYNSLNEVLIQALDHEKLITSKINELAHAAMTTRTIRPSTSCNGTLRNSMKKRSCLKPYWTNWRWSVKAAMACSW